MCKNKNLLWTLLVTLCLLSVADFVITREYLVHIGNIGEANPFLRFGIDRFGVNFIIHFKLIALALMTGCICGARPLLYKRISIALVALNVVSAGIVGYGLFCLSSI